MLTRCRRQLGRLVAGIIFTIWLPLVGAQDLHGWVADSKVTGIQLVSVENAGTLLNFQLKNFSSTSIAALVIATPDGNKHFADFSREELAPNAVYSLLIDSAAVADGKSTISLVALFRHRGAVNQETINGAAVADVKHAISLVALVRADGSAEGLQPEIN